MGTVLATPTTTVHSMYAIPAMPHHTMLPYHVTVDVCGDAPHGGSPLGPIRIAHVTTVILVLKLIALYAHSTNFMVITPVTAW